MRARRSVLGLILTLALFGTACAGSDDNESSGGETSGSTGKKGVPAADAADINPVPRDKVADGGTLVWPITEVPPNFNYHQVDGSLRDNADVLGGTFFGTFKYDAKAQPTLDKDYFESIDLTSTDPKQVITYRLNPKTVWGDGTPITFKDFEASWKASNGTNLAYKVSSTQGDDKIESVVQGQDDREIIVTMKEKYADWRGLFSAMYPASTNNDPAVFNDGWKEKPLTTAGPFRFESIDRTAQTITMVRNEKWWGNPAKLDKIIYRVLDADQHVEALVNGEVDFAEIGPDINKFTRASTAGLQIRKASGPDFRHVTINGASPVLSDVKVRKGLAQAIDREILAKAILGPLGIEGKPLGNHILMGTQVGYKNNAGALSKADPEAAGKLLDEAGWVREGTGVRKKDGKDLAIRFVIPSGVATSAQESDLVRKMLGEIGVTVNVETVPVGDFFEKYIRTGNFDFTVFSWIGTVFPISSAKSIYQNPLKDEKGEPVTRQNFTGVGSPEIDALFDKATGIFDQDEANKIANQIDTMIWDEVHSLTMYQRPQIQAVKNPKLANFGASGFQSTPYEDFGYAKA